MYINLYMHTNYTWHLAKKEQARQGLHPKDDQVVHKQSPKAAPTENDNNISYLQVKSLKFRTISPHEDLHVHDFFTVYS